MTTSTPPITTGSFAKGFNTLDEASPIHALRTRAFEQFNDLGLPTMKDEQWRYTSIKPITRGEFELSHDGSERISRAVIDEHVLKDTPCRQLVFVNGHYAPQLSDPGVALKLEENGYAGINGDLKEPVTA